MHSSLQLPFLNFLGCLVIRNKILGFELVSQLVGQGSNGLGSHTSTIDNNLDVITDDKGNMVIRPHSQ